MYPHNHCPATSWCAAATCSPSGSRRSANSAGKWLSGTAACAAEPTRGTKRAFLCKVPDRNMTGSSLRCDPDSGRIYLCQRRRSRRLVAQSGAHGADLGRQRRDMEPPADRLPEQTSGHQVIAGMIRSSEGWLINACDGGPDNNEGSVIQISRDDGRSWTSPAGKSPKKFRSGTHRRHDRGHPRLRRPAQGRLADGVRPRQRRRRCKDAAA